MEPKEIINPRGREKTSVNAKIISVFSKPLRSSSVTSTNHIVQSFIPIFS